MWRNSIYVNLLNSSPLFKFLYYIPENVYSEIRKTAKKNKINFN